MKYIITAIFFLFSLTLFSQDVGRRLTTGKVFHTQLGSGVGYFDVEVTFTDEGGLFDGTSVAIGDYLFVSDGGFGYYLPITQVLSSGPVTCQIRVSNIGLPIGGISSDLGYVTKGTSKFKFIPYVGGLSNANQQINSEEFISRLDSILKFKLPERTSGSIPPAYTPSSTDSWIAQNASGDVYKFNGTTWSLVGGLVTTNAPLIGIGTALDPIGLDSFSINDAYITQNSIDSTELSQSGISLLNLARNGADLSQTIRWNGTRWIPSPEVIDGDKGHIDVLSGVWTVDTSVIGPIQLQSSGVVAATYGSSTAIPVITIDADGRITSASTSAVLDPNLNNEGLLGVANGGGGSAVITSNTSGALGVSLIPTTGITFTNVVSANGGGITFTVADNSNSNEGRLGVGGSGITTRTITTNTTGSNPINITAGSGIDLTGSVGGSNGGTIGIRNTGDLSTSNEGILSLLPFGSNGGRITSNTSGSGSPKFVGTGNTTITVNNDTLFINSTSGISSVFTSGIITGDGTTGNRIRLDTTGLGDNEYVMTYNGSVWSASTLFSGGGITGNGTSTTPFQLDDLGATVGQVIKWNGTAWVAANDSVGSIIPPLGGDLSGTLSSANVIKIRNIPVSSTAPTLNQILKFDGTQYVPSIDTFRWALKAPNGTSTAPSYTFENSQGTGIYAAQGVIPRLFISGASSTTSTRGTGINLTAGSNSSTGVGGTISFSAGGSVSSSAGAITFNAGSASSNGAGGQINMLAGNSTTGTAGAVILTAGTGNNGGTISITAGPSTGTNNGGAVGITSGTATAASRRSGDIIISSGNASDTLFKGIIDARLSNGIALPSISKNSTINLDSKKVGQMVYTTRDTASNGKIGNVRIWNGTEWLPLYTPENTATSVAEPTNQIVYGTGSGVDSDARFKWVPSPSGGGIEVKARQSSLTNNPNANEVWTLYDPNPLAGNIPADKKFGRWYEYTLYDPDLNLLGDPADTVGDMVHIRGYNLGLGDNPKRASAWWQSEQDYNLPSPIAAGGRKSAIEEHFNVRDTLNRLQRLINMFSLYDGSWTGVSFQGNYTSWFRRNSQDLEYVWNFDANKFTIFDTTEIAIANSFPGRIFSKQEVGGLNPLNVVTQKSDNSFIIGDSKGIEVQDTLRLMFAGTQNGGTFTSLGVGTIQLGAAFKIKTTNDRMLSFEKVGIVSPQDWQIRVDANDIWWLGRNASTPLISVYKDATADLFTLRQNKVSVGQGYSIPSRFSVFQASDDQDGALAIVNTARTRQWRQFIEGGVLKIRAASTNNTIPVVAFENTTTGNQLFVSNATPESNITGNQGDLTLANVSGTGKLFGKKTGTGNTGWEEFISTPNIANLLTVGTGTDSTSIIQTNVSGANPITLKAGKDLRISESGSTITLSSNPDVLEFNGFDALEFDCFPPSITPDPLHGPFFAKDTSADCGSAFYQWDHANEQWVSWVPFTGNLNVTPSNRLARINSIGGVSSSSNLYYTGTGAVYFNVPDARRTSGRAPYTAGYDGAAMYAYHLNGTQHTEMRIASYGAGFDLHIEDHNQNESYSTYSTTYRSSATPGSYRAPVVGDLMFRELVRITRGNLPADPYEDACGFYPWDIKVASVGASNNVGTNVNFYTRKSTDPQSISGTGNLTLQLKENQDIRAVNYQLRNDVGTPTYIAGFNADGTFRSDLLSEISITETLGIDTDLGAPDGAILTWNSTSEEWEGSQLEYHFEETNYSATAGATTFTIPITPATPTGAKMPIRVYRNGVKLIYTSGTPNVYQFSYSGTTLSTSACSAGDIISIEYLNY